MLVATLPTSNPPRVYMSVRVLPDPCLPGRVVRQPGKTLAVYDARQTRRAGMTWLLDHLTEAELDVIWPIYHGCPRGESVDSGWAVSDDLVLLYVPPEFRLTGASPLQGGAELVRRGKEGSLTLEIEMYRRELQERRRQVVA